VSPITNLDGSYFWGEIPLDNSTGVVSASLNTLAVLNNGASADKVSSSSGNVLVQQTAETFLYDLDGNLIRDGLWTNTWDAENRLISMQSRTNVPAAVRQKLDFTYDYMGRRIQKIVSLWSGSAYTPQYTNRFVYDGWNLIGILNEANGLVSNFTWGSDLSGSMQGAGGVGGLLFSTIRAGASAGAIQSCVSFDGNGNVTSLVSATNSTVNSSYEYGPFGEVIRATGPTALLNPYRFSTKYQEDETGLLYYGYRYYNASMGRWTSRDPVAESQRAGLYTFARNRPSCLFDILGRLDNSTSGTKRISFEGTATTITASVYGDNLCQGGPLHEKVYIDANYQDPDHSYTLGANYFFDGFPVTPENIGEDEHNWTHFDVVFSFPLPKCPAGQVHGTDYFKAGRAGNGTELTITFDWRYSCDSCCNLLQPLRATFTWLLDSDVADGPPK
jgi:RHS repeat-associated protein